MREKIKPEFQKDIIDYLKKGEADGTQIKVADSEGAD